MADWGILRPIEQQKAPGFLEVLNARAGAGGGGGGGGTSDLLRLAMQQDEKRKKAEAANALAAVVQSGGSPEEISQRAMALGTPESIRLGLEFKQQAGREAEAAWQRNQREAEFGLTQQREARGEERENRIAATAQKAQEIKQEERDLTKEQLKITRTRQAIDSARADNSKFITYATWLRDQGYYPKEEVDAAIKQAASNPETIPTMLDQMDANLTAITGPPIATGGKAIKTPTATPVSAAAPAATAATAGPKAPGAEQMKAATFGGLLEEGSQTVSRLTAEPGGYPSTWTALMDVPYVGGVVKAIAPSRAQEAKLAEEQIVEGWGRFASGADVPKADIDRIIATMLPSIGESAVAQGLKERARERIIQGLPPDPVKVKSEQELIDQTKQRQSAGLIKPGMPIVGPAAKPAPARPAGAAALAPAPGAAPATGKIKTMAQMEKAARDYGMPIEEVKQRFIEKGFTIE